MISRHFVRIAALICFACLTPFAASGQSRAAELKIGIQTFSLRHLSFEESLKVIHDLGVKYIETFEGHLNFTESPERLEEVKNLSRKCFPVLVLVGIAAASVQKGVVTCKDLSSFNDCLKRSNTVCTLIQGLYDIHGTSSHPILEITGSNIIVEGQGRNSTVLRRGDKNALNIMTVSPSSRNVTIRKLGFDGANNFWDQNHKDLKQFLQSEYSQDYQDLKLNTAEHININNCGFVESGRHAIHFSGSKIVIRNNIFNGGLDAAIRSHNIGPRILDVVIADNDIRHYRAAGIVLMYTLNAIVKKNLLYHNHFGDPYGGDVGLVLQGGGQIYLAAHASQNKVEKNMINGAYWEGSGAFPPLSSYPIMNYGVEIDGIKEPGSDNKFSSNTIINHGVSGYWIGGNNARIVLEDETILNNKIHGIQVLDLKIIPGVEIRGGRIQYNERWNWPNGANWPKWFGLWTMNVVSGSVRVRKDTNLSPNAGGANCHFDGKTCIQSPITWY